MKQRIFGERYGPLTFEWDFSLKVHAGDCLQISPYCIVSTIIYYISHNNWQQLHSCVSTAAEVRNTHKKISKTDEGNFMEGLNKVNTATCVWWHLSEIYFDRCHHLSCYFAYVKTLNEQKYCQNQSNEHETIRKQKTGTAHCFQVTVTQPAIQRRLHSFPRQSERVQLPSASPERTRKPAQPARPN